jgi:hypothetical protein
MSDGKASKPAPGGTSTPSRDKIDTGRTDGKVKTFDPAMSPLGTDEEAASPHDEEGLRVAREASRKVPGSRP